MAKRGWSIDSLVLIFSFVVIAQLLSYVVSQGTFDRMPVPDNPHRMMVVAGTYETVAADERVILSPWYALVGVTKGLASAQDIIFLIFIVGGVIEVLRRSGAIDAALHGAVARLGHSPWILIAGCFAMFSLGSFTIGMGEEYVPLIPIIVTMSLAMRMDGVVAMGMVWIPYGIGWGCAGINPFGVLIAQNIAGVPLTSGWEFRIVMMLAFLALGFHHLYSYAKRVQRDPSQSLVADVDYSNGFEPPHDIEMNGSRIAILSVFVLGLAGFVWGAANQGWYIEELNAVFLAIGLVTAVIARIPPSETSRVFLEGAAKMTAPALIVGFARAIAVVLEDGQIIDTVVHFFHPVRFRAGVRNYADHVAARDADRRATANGGARLPVRRRLHEHDRTDERAGDGRTRARQGALHRLVPFYWTADAEDPGAGLRIPGVLGALRRQSRTLNKGSEIPCT
jgi:uncharacterized ion transporter superfamily protein YfcC